MHEMTCFGHDLELVFALHLRDREGFIETVSAGKDEEFRDAAGWGEEFG